MHLCTSVRGVPIRLTAERWMHIVEARDELAGRLPDVLDAVERPDWVTKGYRDALVAWIRLCQETLPCSRLQGDRKTRRIHRNGVRCLKAEEEKPRMALGQLRKKDLNSILSAVPTLVRMPEKCMWVDYDSDADVLYIAFQRPQRATDSELRDDGVIVHRRGNRIVGVTILDASKR